MSTPKQTALDQINEYIIANGTGAITGPILNAVLVIMLDVLGDPQIGPQGPQGERGEQGPAGNTGAQGVAGPTGPQGVAGPVGPAGPTGSQGIQGPIGPQGLRGIQGPEGPVGPQGPQGLEGPRGGEGPQGIQGIQGPQGDKGDTGDIGPVGPSAPGIYADNGAPITDGVINGDIYLNIDNGDLYKWDSFASDWSNIGALIPAADAVPTAGSANPVQSGGVYNALLAITTDLSDHTTDTANPHQTTLEQVRSQNNQIAGDIDANNHTINNLPDAVSAKQPITKQQFDSVISSTGRNRGGIDCSANPNYPASNAGDRWEVIVAGKIGGASGITVDAFDEIVCKTTSAAGTQAVVGVNFYVVQGNISRATETTGGYAQLATNAQAVALTDDTTILTPLKGAALFDQKKKTRSYQINFVSVIEVMVIMEFAGQVNSVLVYNISSVKLKIGTGGTYPVGAQTYPFAYAAGDIVFITYNYSNANDTRGNVKLKCQDN